VDLLKNLNQLPLDMARKDFWRWVRNRYINTAKKIFALLGVGLTMVVFTGYDEILRPWLNRFWIPNLFSLFCLSLVSILWDIVVLWPEDKRARRVVNQIGTKSRELRPLVMRFKHIDPRQLKLDLTEKK
jgi:hypothetical protein